MDEGQSTCGKGLAVNAVLPKKFGVLMEAMAALLENHTRSLPPNDANAQLERQAYAHLFRDQRVIAARLAQLAEAMESYRDLPMGGMTLPRCLTKARATCSLPSSLRKRTLWSYCRVRRANIARCLRL